MYRLTGTGGIFQKNVWPLDERFLLLPRRGIIGIVRAQGPTYGGYYRSVNLDVGYQTVLDRLLELPSPLSTADLTTAMLEAHRELSPSDPDSFHKRLMHTAWTMTIATIAGEQLIGAHIGVCRAYLWRNQRLSQLTEDHSARNMLPADPRSDLFKDVEMTCLGLKPNIGVDAPRIDTFTVSLAGGDMLLFITPGVWLALSDKQLSDLITVCKEDSTELINGIFRELSYDKRLGASAVVARVFEA